MISNVPLIIRVELLELGTTVCTIDKNYILNPDLPSNHFPQFPDDISTWPSII